MQSFLFLVIPKPNQGGETEKSVQTKVMDSFDAHENSDLEIKERWDVEREKNPSNTA